MTYRSMSRVSSLEPEVDEDQLDGAGEVLSERAERHQGQCELVVEHHQHADVRLSRASEVEPLPSEQRQQGFGLLAEQPLRRCLADGMVRRRVLRANPSIRPTVR